MKTFNISAEFEIFDSFEELPDNIGELMKKTFEARDKAYAPYSRFQVGAALLLDNGEIITGSNQENASYPSGLCAERTAVFYAGAKFPEARIECIAVSATSLKRPVTSPVPPCGACRQALVEYEVKQKTDMEVYFMGESGAIVKAKSVKDLLPLIFDNSYL
ncbi:MAG: cytidine deaminase [Salegentibacter sp.]|uniref:Cytidine deaminase n=1 Tax=Salegentibacter flavus TaxID=287099 RepID=A0A1I5AHD8_9FLAO|nr:MULTISPECIES: cytidine deaminase [Salegentibacter]MDR9457065.1 cytidine deaminase [Salegentibacter sp.]SFN61848.1 cytidine deaminase [Salegentibacter flavus]